MLRFCHSLNFFQRRRWNLPERADPEVLCRKKARKIYLTIVTVYAEALAKGFLHSQWSAKLLARPTLLLPPYTFYHQLIGFRVPFQYLLSHLLLLLLLFVKGIGPIPKSKVHQGPMQSKSNVFEGKN